MEQKKQYTAIDLLKAIAGVIALLTGFYFAAQKWDLTFDSQDEKVRNKRHLENIGTESDVAREKERNKMFIEDVYKFIEHSEKDNRDMKKHIHNMDSIQKDQFVRFNDQIYQLNQKTNQ